MRPYSIAATRPHEASPLKQATCASAFSWHRRIQTGCPELTGATEPQIIDLWRDVDQISRANPSSRRVFPPIRSFLHCPVHGAPPLNMHLRCSGPALVNFILIFSSLKPPRTSPSSATPPPLPLPSPSHRPASPLASSNPPPKRADGHQYLGNGFTLTYKTSPPSPHLSHRPHTLHLLDRDLLTPHGCPPTSSSKATRSSCGWPGRDWIWCLRW